MWRSEPTCIVDGLLDKPRVFDIFDQKLKIGYREIKKPLEKTKRQ